MWKILVMFVCSVSIMAGPGLKKEAIAPRVKLKTAEGGSIVLGNTGDKQILVFYRGSWCPYCMTQLKDLAANLASIANEKGYKLLAISTDQLKVAKKMKRKFKYPFTIVSDPKAKSLRAYKIANKIADDKVAMYKVSYKIDIEADSGETHHLIAHPAVFVIANGKVSFADIHTDYKMRTPISEIIKAL